MTLREPLYPYFPLEECSGDSSMGYLRTEDCDRFSSCPAITPNLPLLPVFRPHLPKQKRETATMQSSAANPARVSPLPPEEQTRETVPSVTPARPCLGPSKYTLHTFPVQDVFVSRHEQGTIIEMENEQAMLEKMNAKKTMFKAWPVSPIPNMVTAFAKSWLVLVETPRGVEDNGFPALTDRFTIDFDTKIEREEGTFSLVHLSASRISNPYENTEDVGPKIPTLAAFQVEVPRSWKRDNGDEVELDLMAQIQTDIDQSDGLGQHHLMTIRYDTFSLTYDAELAALRHLVEEKRIEERKASEKSLAAFQLLLNFKGAPKTFTNLHDTLPHLANPTNPFFNVTPSLVNKFRSFNRDQINAYYGLTKVPNGLYFVNGCPGAGKTEWNMVLAALIHARRRPGSKRPRSPILFLVDINKTVDDAANRYLQLCKECGIKPRIVRMHGWPYEMRNSNKLKTPSTKDTTKMQESGEENEPDYTRRFLLTANLTLDAQFQRDPNKAPTLDEAAWDYYDLHKKHAFEPLRKLLDRMNKGVVFTTEDWKSLRSRISGLYRVVLAQTDFVATTPVATYGSFARLFKPDVIFIDEAPHARELTTLIPIAFFDPLMWIFSGDVKQTQPFVKGAQKEQAEREGLKANPYANQLKISTMARAASVGAINSWLNVNNRAHGNLHRLPSEMFYESKMTSSRNDKAMYPASTQHLKGFLEKLGTAPCSLDENRVVVQLKDSCEDTQRTSFWNPRHHQWVVEKVETLLQDPHFRSLRDPEIGGKIMIQTPYKTAARQYAAHAKQWPEAWQNRVLVLTVDAAQGNQADVVFLDMVRTKTVGFMDDPKRLNVAITRAQQAEIIVTHEKMTWKAGRYRSEHTSKIWDDAVQGGRLISL